MRALLTERCVFDKNHQPIMMGKLILQSFLATGTVVLMSEDPERSRLDLITHHMDEEHKVSIYEIDDLLSMQENVQKVRSMDRIDILVDSDPALITWAYSQGVNCLMALDPKFMDPRFRPDGGGVVAWAHLLDEIESQVRLLARKREGWEKSGFNTWE